MLISKPMMIPVLIEVPMYASVFAGKVSLLYMLQATIISPLANPKINLPIAIAQKFNIMQSKEPKMLRAFDKKTALLLPQPRKFLARRHPLMTPITLKLLIAVTLSLSLSSAFQPSYIITGF